MIVELARFYFVSTIEVLFRYELTISRSLSVKPCKPETLAEEIAAASV